MITRILGTVLVASVLVGCSDDVSSSNTTQASHRTPPAAPLVGFTDDERQRILSLSPLPPPPADPTNAVADDPRAAAFGQFLFFDDRLSADGSVSCATCHDPELAFADGKRLGSALGIMTRHTPALANVVYNRWLFWDGRADTLWAQALGPIENEREHGASRLQCAHVVYDDPELRRVYETLFGPLPDLADGGRFPPQGRPVAGDPEHPHALAWASMTSADQDAVNRVFANLGKAIAAYERRIVSRRSPFDVFVEGVRDGDAARMAVLDEQTQHGLKLFIGRANCTLCHFGPNFSDGEFHSTGVPPLDGRELTDAGRYDGVVELQSSPFNAAGVYSDAEGKAAERAASKVTSLVHSTESWGQFKTPTLREVARTAPYMHQGQFDTLDRVLRHYSTLEDAVLPSHHQEQLLVPLDLSEDEIASIVAFLGSLTSEPLPAGLLQSPESPESPNS